MDSVKETSENKVNVEEKAHDVEIVNQTGHKILLREANRRIKGPIRHSLAPDEIQTVRAPADGGTYFRWNVCVPENPDSDHTVNCNIESQDLIDNSKLTIVALDDNVYQINKEPRSK